MSPDPRKHKVLADMPPPMSKKELEAFFGVLNYLSKVPPVTSEVYKPLKLQVRNFTHTTKNSSIQNQDIIQAQTRPIHSRLVVM